MSTAIEPWGRPLFQSGGQPNVFHLFCFSKGPLADAVQPVAHFGLPNEDAMRFVQVQTLPREVEPAWFDGFRSGALRALASESLGDALALLDAATQMTVIVVQRPDSPDLAHLQAGWAVAKQCIARGSQVVLDAQCNRFWSAQEVAQWPNHRPLALSTDVTFIVEAEPAASHAIVHTRGLAKFGRADLIVEGVPQSRWDAVSALLRVFASQAMLGAVFADGQQMPIEGGTAVFTAAKSDPLHLNNQSMLVTAAS